MGYPLSPGVYSTEIDISAYVPAVSTTDAAIAGVFSWGPMDDRSIVTSEEELVVRFGKPTSDNYETWYSAANFLGYSNKLWVSRASSANAFNAVAGNGTIANTQVLNAVDYDVTPLSANSSYIAKYPGTLGNSLKISVCDSASAYSSVTSSNSTITYGASFGVQSNVATVTVTSVAANGATSNTAAVALSATIQPGDYITAGNSTVGFQKIQVNTVSGVSTANGISTFTVNLKTKYFLAANVTTTGVERSWEFYNTVDRAPGTSEFTKARGGVGDELHVVVVDAGGAFTGTPNTILEVWPGLSRVKNALGEQGGSLYYKDALATGSNYVWFATDRAGVPTVNSANASATVVTNPLTLTFTAGTDTPTESAIALADVARAYDQFKAKDDVDVSLIITGKSIGGTNGEGLARYIIDNIAEVRQDVVVTVSPEVSDVVNAPYQEAENILAFRASLGSSSYAVLDSGYKQQYDRYNNVYRWIPLNADVAGCMARTDELRDPWVSPAGQTRGKIKNVTKLAFNPSTTAIRDILYKADVNNVVTFRTQGTILYGDKTLLGRASAFDRINVRRLFIVLRKAISLAAENTLFELNNEFTRANFRNLVEPFLRDVQGRQGIYAFKVVCDESNNTPSVIDRNEFIGDILVKPAKSINFVKLRFAAVGTEVAFEEVQTQLS